ncbi:hypothetical protein [Streptomyces luteocolor]|uniref:hypothetical protein n=1 Tax=Streptomyces luteocolor TaxID=285500 RepID=UPI000852FF05|nr:hypothetical protein [Streptomyces luteocolor]
MVARSKPLLPGGGPARESGTDPGGGTPDPEGRRYFAVLFLVHLVVMVALIAFAVIGDSATALTVAGGGFIAYVSAAMTFFARRDERQEVTQHLLTFLAAFFVAAVAGAILWWASAAQPDDVLGDAHLKGRTVGAGATAGLVVDRDPGGNDELTVTFAAEDDAAGKTPCLRMGMLSFQGGDIERADPVPLEKTVTTTLRLDDPGPEVTVDIQLVGDADCRVELTLTKAEYRR